jgi:heme exporter protein C
MTWWKYLCIALFFYIFTAGMLIPLKPGVQSVSPLSGVSGQDLDVKIEGYNTFFGAGKGDIAVWLKSDTGFGLRAYNVTVQDDRRATARFHLPASLPTGGAGMRTTLFATDQSTGVALLPDALFISPPDSLVPSTMVSDAASQWSKEALPLNFKQDITFPYRNILYETIRNTFYHVPLWFAMMVLFGVSVVQSIFYLSKLGKQYPHDEIKDYDLKSFAYSEIGLIFGFLGLFTGMLWANYTWGTPWTGDVKLNMTAVLLAVYLAYFVLRMAFFDKELAARVCAVYNILAFASIIPLLFIIPRLQASLHPGNGGNPAMGGEDLDNTMRLVFYPAVIAFILLGIWISDLNFRVKSINERVLENGANESDL